LQPAVKKGIHGAAKAFIRLRYKLIPTGNPGIVMHMKAQIISEKENHLMKRKDYWLSVEHDGKETPCRHDLLPEVVRKLHATEGTVVICKIFSERGRGASRVKVQVYADAKHLPKGCNERQDRKVKKYLEKRKKAAPAGEAPAKEEKHEKHAKPVAETAAEDAAAAEEDGDE
jgi:ribosomal protein S24E